MAAVLGILLLLSSGTAHAASDLPWAEYWRLVDETDQKVTQAEQSPAEAHTLLGDQADQWRGVTRVTLPDGAALAVNSSFLADQLNETHPDFKGLHDLLAQIKAARARESLTTFNAQDAAAVQAILARPEYDWSGSQKNLLQTFLDRLWQKFLEFLAGLSPSSGENLTIDLRPVFTLAVFLVLLLVLYFSTRGVFGELIQEADLGEEGEGEELLTAARAMQRAQGLAAGGDHRQAVRYLYLSALLLLEERGLLRYDRSRTNREYLNSLQEHGKLAANLRGLIDVFDRVWYGYREIDDESFAQYVDMVDRLKEQK